MVEDTKWVNRSGKSKNDREQNCKNNKNKSTKNEIFNTVQKTKD